jgi:hypothetical protein
MSKTLSIEAHAHILQDTKTLRNQSPDQLRRFIEVPFTEQIQIQKRPIEKTTWAQDHQDKLAVIVEARRKRFLGWSQVTADGFYKTSDGTVTDFQERDYWDHGY